MMMNAMAGCRFGARYVLEGQSASVDAAVGKVKAKLEEKQTRYRLGEKSENLTKDEMSPTGVFQQEVFTGRLDTLRADGMKKTGDAFASVAGSKWLAKISLPLKPLFAIPLLTPLAGVHFALNGMKARNILQAEAVQQQLEAGKFDVVHGKAL